LLCFQQGYQFAFEGQMSSHVARDVTPILGEGVTFWAENMLCCVIYLLIIHLIN